MKTKPNDVVVGGAYYFGDAQVIVTAVKPQGVGFYVNYVHDLIYRDSPARMRLGTFRRACNVKKKEIA